MLSTLPCSCSGRTGSPACASQFRPAEERLRTRSTQMRLLSNAHTTSTKSFPACVTLSSGQFCLRLGARCPARHRSTPLPQDGKPSASCSGRRSCQPSSEGSLDASSARCPTRRRSLPGATAIFTCTCLLRHLAPAMRAYATRRPRPGQGLPTLTSSLRAGATAGTGASEPAGRRSVWNRRCAAFRVSLIATCLSRTSGLAIYGHPIKIDLHTVEGLMLLACVCANALHSEFRNCRRRMTQRQLRFAYAEASRAGGVALVL